MGRAEWGRAEWGRAEWGRAEWGRAAQDTGNASFSIYQTAYKGTMPPQALMIGTLYPNTLNVCTFFMAPMHMLQLLSIPKRLS